MAKRTAYRDNAIPQDYVASKNVAPPPDYYLEYIRAEQALRAVAERDFAIQSVLKTFRARLDQQLGEIEAFTRNWDVELRALKHAAAAAQEMLEDLRKACELTQPYLRPSDREQ